jgi:acetyltransferase
VVRNPARPDPLLTPEDLVESFEPVIGQSVTLRPLQPADAAIERSFITGLSERTRYNRLLGGAMKITDAYIRSLIEIDWSRDIVLAAITMLDNAEVIIGVGRYALDADDRSCEFAVVIADAWQGRGIGRRMLEKLLAVARARGLKVMRGEVLSTNRSMLQLARRLGFKLARHPDDATITCVTLTL